MQNHIDTMMLNIEAQVDVTTVPTLHIPVCKTAASCTQTRDTSTQRIPIDMRLFMDEPLLFVPFSLHSGNGLVTTYCKTVHVSQDSDMKEREK